MQMTLRCGWRVWLAAVVLAPLPLAGRDSTAAGPSTESTLFPGHISTIAALAITPDGKTLATGSLDNYIKLWDLTTLKERTTLRGHPGGVQALALTRDGGTLASTSHDDFVKLWDPSNGREKRTIKTGYRVWCVAFSPDGETLVTGGQAPIKLWDVATGAERASLDPGPSKMDGKPVLSMSVAITADGKTLCSGHFDGAIRLWDLATGQVRTIFRVANTAALSSVVLSADDRTLACVHFGGTITLWDLSSGKRRGRIPAERAKARTVAFSPTGRLLASGGQDGLIRLWDTATGKQRLAFPAHADWHVASLAFTPDGKTLYSGAGRELKRGEVKRWDVSAFDKPLENK